MTDKRKIVNAERSEQTKCRLQQQVYDANNQVHDAKYDCSCVNVQGNCTSKITLICQVHGKFTKQNGKIWLIMGMIEFGIVGMLYGVITQHKI